MNRAFPSDEEPSRPARGAPANPPPRPDDVPQATALLHEVRRLLGQRAYAEAVGKLDVHRPAEWTPLDLNAAWVLRLLGQAFLGAGEVPEARDCLEQLRAAQRERPLLPKEDYAAALSDLVKCYRAAGQESLARERQEEARRLLLGG